MHFSHHMLLHLCDTFFCIPYSPQVDNFLLPAMAASTYSFSFSDLVSVLSTHTHRDGSAAKVQKIASLNVPTFVLPLSQVAPENKSDKKLKASPWLLCSILRIGKNHSCEFFTALLLVKECFVTFVPLLVRYCG